MQVVLSVTCLAHLARRFSPPYIFDESASKDTPHAMVTLSATRFTLAPRFVTSSISPLFSPPSKNTTSGSAAAKTSNTTHAHEQRCTFRKLDDSVKLLVTDHERVSSLQDGGG